MALTIEPGFTTAASNFNTTPSVALQQIALQYRGTQNLEEWSANQATVRSLRDQLAAAEGVSAALLERANSDAPGAVQPYIDADNAAAVEWQNSRQATIDASIASQVSTIVGGYPAPFNT